MSARILVVEDNLNSRELMVYLLQAFGHVALEASDGLEGVAVALRERPDFILMDIHMPNMDGYQALREIRADRRVSATPVVAVTALAMVGDRERVKMAGFNGYISKPIAAETFVDQVDAYLPVEKRSPGPVVVQA